MKRIIAAVVILTTAVSPVMSQGLGINFYAGGGLSVPMENLKDLWKTGYQGSVGLGLTPVPTLETVARFGYHAFPSKKDSTGNKDFTISEYGLDVRANLAAPGFKFRPYALIGAGFAKYEFATTTVDQVVGAALEGLEPKTKFFYCFGGGIKVNAAPKLNFYLEGRYTKISVPMGKIDYIPISMGLNLSL